MNENYWTTQAMIESGVPFLVYLAHTYRAGSEWSQQVIREQWVNEWNVYRIHGLVLKAADDAKEQA